MEAVLKGRMRPMRRPALWTGFVTVEGVNVTEQTSKTDWPSFYGSGWDTDASGVARAESVLHITAAQSITACV